MPLFIVFIYRFCFLIQNGTNQTEVQITNITQNLIITVKWRFNFLVSWYWLFSGFRVYNQLCRKIDSI